jgi:hypothetical protein
MTATDAVLFLMFAMAIYLLIPFARAAWWAVTTPGSDVLPQFAAWLKRCADAIRRHTDRMSR